MSTSLNQVLRLSQVLRQAYTAEHLRRYNSVMTPPAQFTTLCEVPTDVDKLSKRLHSIISPVHPAPIIIKAVVELMYLNSLRISEVLKIKGSDISKIGNIFIHASKGSQDRWTVVSIYREFWLSFRSSPIELGSTYSRFYFYREFKKLGIHFKQKGNKNSSITHAFRHLSVTSQQQQVKNISASARSLGHRSTKSTKHYDSKSKETK